MLLKLSVETYQGKPPHFAEESSFGNKGGSIGRASHNDWVLQDPMKFLSGQHATIQIKANQFEITDNSTNGVFINNELLGRDNTHILHISDTIKMGEYEITVSQLQATQENSSETNFPFVSDTASTIQNESAHFDFSIPSPLNNPDNDPFADVFNPKTNDDFLQPQIDTYPNQNNPFSFVPRDTPLTDTKKEKHTSRIQESSIPYQEGSFAVEATEETPDINIHNTRETEKETPSLSTTKQQALAEILKGAGLDISDVPDNINDDTFFSIGQALKASLDGTMHLLASRTEAKNQLRLDKTLIGSQENNPLKFFPTSKHVLKLHFSQSLIADSSYLPLVDALQEAYDDIKAHEFSMATSIQSALNLTIKAYFSPKNIQKNLEKNNPLSSKIPLQREAKLWQLFTDIYDDIAEEASESFELLLAKKIATAYEKQLKEIKRN